MSHEELNHFYEGFMMWPVVWVSLDLASSTFGVNKEMPKSIFFFPIFELILKKMESNFSSSGLLDPEFVLMKFCNSKIFFK